MLKQELICQKKELEVLITTIEKSLSESPKGTLRIARKGTNVQYYYRETPKAKKGVYIHKAQFPLALALAQKDYDRRLLKEAKKKLAYINLVLAKCELVSDDLSLTQVYMNMNAYRKNLIESRVPTEQEYADKWMEEPYQGMRFSEKDSLLFTKRGEQVRSKAEIIIADMLLYMGLVYKYECPIFLKNNEVRYPDFTILLPRTRRIVYLEHCGMMDDEKYKNSFVVKMSSYSNNEITLGRNLFLTFESKSHVLDTREVKRVIESILESDII